MDIRNIGLKNSCEHFIKYNRIKNKQYYSLRDKLYVLVNYFLYKKLRMEKITKEWIIKKWKKVLSQKLRNSVLSYEMMLYMDIIMDSYDNIMDLKCIANPINIKTCGISLNGQIDMITKNNNSYDVYHFMYNSLHGFDTNFTQRVIPGILSMAFYSDFREQSFNIIIHNISTNEKKVIDGAEKQISTLIDRTQSSLLMINNNCKKCVLKGQCKHETCRS